MVAGEQQTLRYVHPLLVRLLPLLESAPTLSQLQEELAGQIAPEAVSQGVQVLCAEQVAMVLDIPIADEAAAAFSLTLRTPPGECAVQVIEAGARLPLDLSSPQHSHTPDKHLRVVSTDDYLRPEVARAVSGEGPTLLVRPVGRRFWIGPLLAPAGAVCYACLAFWLQLHRWRQAQVTKDHACPYPPEPAVAALPSTRALAAGMVATAIDRWAAGDVPDLQAGLVRVDPWDWSTERIRFLPRLDCPRCGNHPPMPLSTRLAVLGHPVSGIVEDVQVATEPVTGLCFALGAVLCPGAMRLSVGGNGHSPDEARTRLIYEAAERFSAVFQGDEPLEWGTTRAPGELPLASLLQYSGNQENAPVPPAPTDAIRRVNARSLQNGRSVPLPAALVYLGYGQPDEPDYGDADTNGCAAGASLEQALRNALLELIERDALAIWWYNQLSRPALEPASLAVPLVCRAADALRQAGRSLDLFDLTHDLGVPVVAAVSANEQGAAIYLGAAADLCPLRAARRATEELLQFWLWDHRQQRVAASRRQWIEQASRETHPFLVPATWTPAGSAAEPQSVHGDVQVLLAALARAGLEALSVDLTRPSLGIPVVRVIVPGLRHHDRRLAPGRLYGVPVRMGWLSTPTPEAACNRYPCPL